MAKNEQDTFIRVKQGRPNPSSTIRRRESAGKGSFAEASEYSRMQMSASQKQYHAQQQKVEGLFESAIIQSSGIADHPNKIRLAEAETNSFGRQQ